VEEFVPDLIEPTPVIKGKKCKILLFGLYIFITYAPFLAGLLIWYMYDFLFGFAFYLFFTLLMGVVISKLRLASIPPIQREMSYNNKAVARWYLGKNICF